MKNLLLFCGLSVCLLAKAQYPIVYQPADTQTINQILTRSETLKELPAAQRFVAIGKLLMDKTYQAKTLEINPKRESLVVNLRTFDCTTFLETALTLTQTVAAEKPNFGTYCAELTKIRYRKGRSDIYAARLHYFTDWLRDKAQRGELEILTEQLGGKPYPKTIDFMGKHPQAYPQMADKRNLAEIQTVEKELNTQLMHYIPKAEVGTIESKLQDGDIIAMTTNTKGLDVVHVGMAMRQNGRIYLLHASSDQKKVAVSPKPLADYLQKYQAQTGIMVARLK